MTRSEINRPAAANSDRLAAIREAVYSDLLLLLPAASYGQTERFIANLALSRRAYDQPTEASRESELFRTFQRFLFLKVSPEIGEIGRTGAVRSTAEIERLLSRKYGDRLLAVPGFFCSPNRTDGSAPKLNLPEGCALYGYRSRLGFLNGILCQPLDQIDCYFLLSAVRFGGLKALRLEPDDQLYFEQWKRPVQLRHNLTSPETQASLTGWKWTGRRFVEPDTRRG